MSDIATPFTAGPMGPEHARVIELLKPVAYLTPADDDFMQRKAGAWTNRSVAQVKTDLGVPDILRNQIRLAMQMADVRNTVAGLGNGIADTFDDASGVDAAGSTNESVQAGYVRPDIVAGAIESAQSLPPMTGNSAPAGYVASTSDSSATAYQAFDQTTLNAIFATGGWLKRQTPSAIRVAKYAIISSSNAGNETAAPVNFVLAGSNDGTNWTTLVTRTGVAWAPGPTSQRQEFTITAGNRGYYSQYRLLVTTVNGAGVVQIQEMELLQQAADTYAALDLRSVAFTAVAAPTVASLTIAASAVGGSITPNTNLIAYVSRDNGTTWTTATLAARADPLSDGTTVYESGEISISGQPSGTSMKWRAAATASAFEIRVNAAAMYWR